MRGEDFTIILYAIGVFGLAIHMFVSRCRQSRINYGTRKIVLQQDGSIKTIDSKTMEQFVLETSQPVPFARKNSPFMYDDYTLRDILYNGASYTGAYAMRGLATPAATLIIPKLGNNVLDLHDSSMHKQGAFPQGCGLCMRCRDCLRSCIVITSCLCQTCGDSIMGANYNITGLVTFWFEDNVLHRDGAPAVMSTNYEAWWLNGKRRRVDISKPVVSYVNYQEWRNAEGQLDSDLHGECPHPAIIQRGSTIWYNNGAEIGESKAAFDMDMYMKNVLMDQAEGQSEEAEGQSEEAEGQSEEAEGQSEEAEGQSEEDEGQSEEDEGQ